MFFYTIHLNKKILSVVTNDDGEFDYYNSLSEYSQKERYRRAFESYKGPYESMPNTVLDGYWDGTGGDPNKYNCVVYSFRTVRPWVFGDAFERRRKNIHKAYKKAISKRCLED